MPLRRMVNLGYLDEIRPELQCEAKPMRGFESEPKKLTEIIRKRTETHDQENLG